MLKKGQVINPVYLQVTDEICRLMGARNRECVAHWPSTLECSILVHRQGEFDVELWVRVAFDPDGFNFSTKLKDVDELASSGRLNFSDPGILDKTRATLHHLINELQWT